jgi:hypothetical protein
LKLHGQFRQDATNLDVGQELEEAGVGRIVTVGAAGAAGVHGQVGQVCRRFGKDTADLAIRPGAFGGVLWYRGNEHGNQQQAATTTPKQINTSNKQTTYNGKDFHTRHARQEAHRRGRVREELRGRQVLRQTRQARPFFRMCFDGRVAEQNVTDLAQTTNEVFLLS